MEEDGGLLILLFSPHLLWCVFLVCSSFSAVVCFFFLPYFVGFQLFGLIVAQEAQKQVGDWVESGKVTKINYNFKSSRYMIVR